MDRMGEYACCVDAFSAAKEGRVEGPLLCALAIMGVLNGVTADQPRSLHGATSEEERYPSVDKSHAPRLLCNNDRMASCGGFHRESERKTGYLGRAERGDRCGRFWHLLSMVHVAAFAAKRHPAGLVCISDRDGPEGRKGGAEAADDSSTEREQGEKFERWQSTKKVVNDNLGGGAYVLRYPTPVKLVY